MEVMSVCGRYQITAMVTGDHVENNHLPCCVEDIIIRIDHHFTVNVTEEASDHEVVVQIMIQKVMVRWVVYRTNISGTLVALVEGMDRLATRQNRFSLYIIKCRFHLSSVLRLRFNVNYSYV